MRADGASAWTWLLGAVAAWALCAWLLALLGMGGSVRTLPEDPALLQPLPQAVKAPPARLGALAQYAEIGRRPLFSPDRRPQSFIINPEEEGDGARDFDYVLTSVLIAPDFRMAILQPRDGGDPVRVKVGAAPESAPGWRLVSLEPRRAVFDGPEGERRLELRVFDGEGGLPPTPMSAGNDAAPATARQPRPAPDDMGMESPESMSGAAPGAAGAAGATGATGAVPQRPDQVPDTAEPDNRASAEQIEAIRKRIEARRAKLREEQNRSAKPDRNP